MIKKLNKTKSYKSKRKPEWSVDRGEYNLFTKRPPLRQMKVLVDADLLEQSESHGKLTQESKAPKEVNLMALLSHDYVQYYRYSDSGPPNSQEPLEFSKLNPSYPVYVGWAIVHDYKKGRWPVTYTIDGHPEGCAVARVSSNAPEIAGRQPTNSTEAKFTQKERKKDVLALHVASEALNADLYITERPYLHTDSKLTGVPGLTVCTVDEAITIIALYLRTQRELILPPTSSNLKFSFKGGLYFWVGARELLPEAWRWHSACVKHSSSTNDNKLSLLSGSTISRVARALQERDDVHVALNQVTNNDTMDDALGSLDNILMLLMGAVDASARVANKATGVNFNRYNAKWQKTKWVKEIEKVAPALSSIVDSGSNGGHVLTILRHLRNSVHGIALQGVKLLKNGKKKVLLGLPVDKEPDILAAMDALGGRSAWGIRPVSDGRSHVEPDKLVDKLFDETVGLLNKLMKETPVESLPHVGNLPSGPPKGKDENVFTEWNRKAIRKQLGF